MSCFHRVGHSFLLRNFVPRTYALSNIPSSINNWNVRSQRNYSQGMDDPQIASLRRKKKIFAISLFSSTLLIVWALKKKKDIERNRLLKDCFRIPIQQHLFNAKVSFYRYKGFVFPDQIVFPGILENLNDFKFRETDIVVASFPKSGTTWTQEIVYMLHHNCQRSDSSSEVLETRFPYLEYPYPGMKAISSKSGRRFIKTHLPFLLLPESFSKSGAKVIYIFRNPRDVATSYWHFMKLLTIVGFTGSFGEFADLFLSDKVSYGPYFAHLRSYHEAKTNPNVLIVAFEDLKKNPVGIIEKIADFLQISISEAEALEVARATTFFSMAENASVNYEHWQALGFAHKDGKFLRRGIVGDWKNHFTPEIQNKFEKWENANMEPNFHFSYG